MQTLVARLVQLLGCRIVSAALEIHWSAWVGVFTSVWGTNSSDEIELIAILCSWRSTFISPMMKIFQGIANFGVIYSSRSALIDRTDIWGLKSSQPFTSIMSHLFVTIVNTPILLCRWKTTCGCLSMLSSRTRLSTHRLKRTWHYRLASSAPNVKFLTPSLARFVLCLHHG